MPKLAVFPKAYMTALCKDGSMKLSQWIALASQLEVEGLEWYAGFLEMKDKSNWSLFCHMVQDHGKVIPMLCYSPDFTHPDFQFRIKEIEKQKRAIDMARELGASYCRILSGQHRPGLSIAEGLKITADCIEACLLYAQESGVTLVLENHYKDDFWQYPEFALKSDTFCELVSMVNHPSFGVNFDPSNVLLAGDNPIELLKKVSKRVITMHASDRYIKEGTLQDLRREETNKYGYASRLAHGEIGKGLIDYDAILSELRNIGFDGWISIEDGVEGFDQLQRSVRFLHHKIKEYW